MNVVSSKAPVNFQHPTAMGGTQRPVVTTGSKINFEEFVTTKSISESGARRLYFLIDEKTCFDKKTHPTHQVAQIALRSINPISFKGRNKEEIMKEVQQLRVSGKFAVVFDYPGEEIHLFIWKGANEKLLDSHYKTNSGRNIIIPLFPDENSTNLWNNKDRFFKLIVEEEPKKYFGSFSCFMLDVLKNIKNP